MACIHCGASKTIDAHLIPKAFVMEVKSNRNEQHLLLHKGAPGPKVSNTGVYDTEILCGPCDNLLGRYEAHVFELLKSCRKHRFEPGKVVTIRDLDGDMLVRLPPAWPGNMP